MKKKFLLIVSILLILACSLPGTTATPTVIDEISVGVAVAGTQTALAFVEAPPNATTEVVVPSVIPATQPPSPTATITHLLTPAEPPSFYESYVPDRNSSSTASKHAANGGENFAEGLYERPFNANTMDIYYPDLDITKAKIDRTGAWVYFEIELSGTNTQSGKLEGNYGVELDLDVDGRGDWLILASKPQATWSTEGVRVWQDTNHDIGNDYPVFSDPPQKGNGYELLYFDQGNNPDPDIAFARISPQNAKIVQIAFKPSLIANDNYFMWGAWTDQGVFNPAFYDYNDHFTHAEAGSPLPGLTKYYPLKALFEVDNTCREAVGFIIVGGEPGSCTAPPTKTPVPPVITSTPTETLTPTNTPYTIY